MEELTEQERAYWLGEGPNWYVSAPKNYTFLDNNGQTCTVIGASSYEQAKAHFDKTNSPSAEVGSDWYMREPASFRIKTTPYTESE